MTHQKHKWNFYFSYCIHVKWSTKRFTLNLLLSCSFKHFFKNLLETLELPTTSYWLHDLMFVIFDQLNMCTLMFHIHANTHMNIFLLITSILRKASYFLANPGIQTILLSFRVSFILVY
jgi:hypothetical protein